jgi:uncharacterized protein involved in exopolysaccharide biosynthesis
MSDTPIPTRETHNKAVDFEGSMRTDQEMHAAEEEVTFRDIGLILYSRRRFLGVSTLAVIVLAVIACLVLPKRYTATTTLLPPQQNSSLSSALLSQMGGSLGILGSLAGGSLPVKNSGDMTVALLKSRTLEDAMIDRFDLMKVYKDKKRSDTRKDLESHCAIESKAKEGLVFISVDDKKPERAAEMANAYVDEFRKFSATLAITEASQRRLFFQQQLEHAKDDLASAEEALKATEQKTGLIHLDSQAKALVESVAMLRAQVTAKEVQIRSMSLAETPNNPDILMAREQLAALQNQLKQLAGSNVDPDSDLIVPRGKIPEVGLTYVRKFRDVKYNELIYELLAKQFEIAKLDEAREGSLVQVVDLAVVPDRKSFPRMSIILPIVTGAWLLLAFIWVFSTARKSPALNGTGGRWNARAASSQA